MELFYTCVQWDVKQSPFVDADITERNNLKRGDTRRGRSLKI